MGLKGRYRPFGGKEILYCVYLYLLYLPRHPTLGSRRLDTAVACAATAVSTTARPRTTDGRTAFSDQSTLSRSRHEPTRSHHNERHFSDVLHRQKHVIVNTTSHYPQTRNRYFITR